MIFISVGTEKFPFDRLLKTIDQAVENKEIQTDVFAQTGACLYTPKFYRHEKYLPFSQMSDYIQKADVIVMHAGVGSFLSCLSCGKLPILFPRKAFLKEHLDDHQMEFAGKMAEIKKALVAYEDQELIQMIKNYKSLIKNQQKTGLEPKPKAHFIETLNQYVH